MFYFHKSYFLLAAVLFLLLLIIAAFVHDAVIRPYGGDLLVVIFLYSLLRSFVKTGVKTAIFMVLLFAFGLEVFQAFPILKMMGLEENVAANIVLGNQFDWLDIISYSLGALLVFIVDQKRTS